MNETPNFTLRPVADTDRELLLAVYAASRAIELSMVPWDDEQKRAFVAQQLDAQTAFYAEKYADASHEIIVVDDIDVGRLYVDRREGEIAILDVAVLVGHRGRGVGTSVIEALKAEAAASNCTVGVYVEVYNPSQKLFEKLGFVMTSDDGMNRRFEWCAA